MVGLDGFEPPLTLGLSQPHMPFCYSPHGASEAIRTPIDAALKAAALPISYARETGGRTRIRILIPQGRHGFTDRSGNAISGLRPNLAVRQRLER
jgi:hypothetical protein